MTKEVTKTIIREVHHSKPSKKKTQTIKRIKSESIPREVLQNLIELQKVHTNLAEKFDKLSKQISDLLALFEMAARSFAASPNVKGIEKDKEFLDKIDRLLEQNKTIAKGLTLMEERIRERVYGQPNQPISPEDKDLVQSISSTNKPLPKF